MALSEKIGLFFSRIFFTMKSESAEWKKSHLAELDKLSHDRDVLKVQLQQTIEKMDIRFKEECNRIRMEEERQTDQFKEFLDSIDEMKSNMLSYYTSMPKPVALMIHHHASELLKEAWFSQDTRERIKNQTKFTNLMLTITEDLAALDIDSSPRALPERTLALIQDQGDG